MSVYWIPSQTSPERNERPDKSAKKAAIGDRIGTAKQTNLTQIKPQITDKKKTPIYTWYESKIKKGVSGRRGHYISYFKTQIEPLLRLT